MLTATTPAPARSAASGGVSPRTSRSWVASVSLTSRVTRSPPRNRCTGSVRASRVYTRTRTSASVRRAASCVTSRSR
ncbi:hypothetical protein BJF78_30545 [Pseudonocardia sp. CNS-139]|nr:hypothetical protein BJF78_30545 [Pseudonocardia sp. CNS-139]